MSAQASTLAAMITTRPFPLGAQARPQASTAQAFAAYDESASLDPRALRCIDTEALTRGETVVAMPADSGDASELIAHADRADWMLLRLVVCASLATLLLALASSLGH